MKKLAVLAIAGLMSVTASASNWVQVAQSDSTDFYIDTDSLGKSGFYKQAFIKYANHEVQTVDDIKYDTVVALHQIDCTNQPQIRALSILFILNGETADYNDIPSKWITAYPDTPSEDITKFICSY